MKKLILLAVLTLVAAPLFAADVFTIDKGHSSAMFRVRHMMANFTGRFTDFDAQINLNRDNPSASSVAFDIKAASIDTDNENRDKHLRSADFFDVEKYPLISFRSTAIKASGKKDVYDVTGDLTMHGVTKRITIPVEVLGSVKTPNGEKAGFETQFTINRKDYGIVWNRVMDSGAVLGEDVKVTINIEANGPKPAAAK